MWIFLELFDGIQVGGLSSYLVSLSTLSNDFSQCQIFSSALGALVLFLSTKFGKIKRRFKSFNCLFIFSFDKFCTLRYFCAEVYFTYVELGSMWTLVDLS